MHDECTVLCSSPEGLAGNAGAIQGAGARERSFQGLLSGLQALSNPAKRLKLESFDTMIGKAPNAVHHVCLSPPMEPVQRAALPQWLSTPLTLPRLRSMEPSADGSHGDPSGACSVPGASLAPHLLSSPQSCCFIVTFRDPFACHLQLK